VVRLKPRLLYRRGKDRRYPFDRRARCSPRFGLDYVEKGNFFFIIILTAIGLMPGGSVTKIGRTYKKWTYIARKQNVQLTKKSLSGLEL
jgi:hypothetical protein